MAPELSGRGAVGNILGSARAETDAKMLERAFVETEDYRALIETRDFSFVVGRRGTGKSALFHKTRQHFAGQEGTFLLAETPQEHETVELQRVVHALAEDFRSIRLLSRLAWKITVLLSVTNLLLRHHKAHRTSEFAFLTEYMREHSSLLSYKGPARCAEILKRTVASRVNSKEAPAQLANVYQLERLERAVKVGLADLNKTALAMYDGLDEGWSPDQVATAVLAGLAAAVSDFGDSRAGIHGLLFIRDNMFRALAHLDTDFSRHIEGNTLRLHWDEHSLFHLVAARLRVFLSLDQVESDTKVWNRFAQRSLKDRSGFISSLRYTLYRPRDILVLLNRAYVLASRQGRNEIIEDDIEATATEISQDRLADLLKEYQTVLPGLGPLVKLFQGRSPIDTFSSVISLLEEAAATATFAEWGEGDFALLGSANQMFFALYGVGFIGVRDSAGKFGFCHDGFSMNLESVEARRPTAIHPCYWRALGLTTETRPEEVVVEINDEYEVRVSKEVVDRRTERLGQILAELPRVPMGEQGSIDFEDWVYRAVKILFSGRLINPQLKPNPGAIQQRDIVATNMANEGFWRRVREDYGARQVIFEVKNYESVKLEDYRQVLSYTTGEYGQFAIIVSRTGSEGVGTAERGWLQEMWNAHKRLILTVPAQVLARCLSKRRSAKRYDYTEDALGKRMDTFVRSYLSLRHERRSRPRRRKVDVTR